MQIENIVFDIGNILIDWQPHLAWIDDLGSREAVQAFIDRSGFMALNERGDAGERFADLAREVADPEDQRRVADYVPLYSRTIVNGIEGTWDLMAQLRARGLRIHAITNWSAETWPEGLKSQPRLGTAFETLVVSGEVHLAKPDPRIYTLFCDRAAVAPETCLFIDDKAENVAAAQGVGMDAVQFTTPEALRKALQARSLI